MASFSEYECLETVLLGSVDEYQPAIWCWRNSGILKNLNFTSAIEIAKSAIPKSILEEVKEDLDEYGKVLSKLGVTVLRPPRIEIEPILENKNFQSFGNDFYNMRDLHIVLGDLIVSAAPAQPNRILEIKNLKVFFTTIAREYKLDYLESPIPLLERDPEKSYMRDELGSLVKYEESSALALGAISSQVWHRLEEKEVLFDAANIIRFGRDALYLISSTGNRMALDWLQKKIRSVNFYSTDVYRSSHIDSTILPLNSETFLVNSVRVNSSNLPNVIKNKKILYFKDVEPLPQNEIEFHENYRLPSAKQIENLGFNTNLKEMSSPWAGLNVLSVDEKTILVESNQISLIRFLEKAGYTIIPIRMRHPYTMLGGLHCTTLDIKRKQS